jgi:hypothetical protein
LNPPLQRSGISLSGGTGIFLLLPSQRIERGVQITVGSQAVEGKRLPVKGVASISGAGETIGDCGEEIGGFPEIAPVQPLASGAIERICRVALQPRRPEIGNS